MRREFFAGWKDRQAVTQQSCGTFQTVAAQRRFGPRLHGGVVGALLDDGQVDLVGKNVLTKSNERAKRTGKVSTN